VRHEDEGVIEALLDCVLALAELDGAAHLDGEAELVALVAGVRVGGAHDEVRVHRVRVEAEHLVVHRRALLLQQRLELRHRRHVVPVDADVRDQGRRRELGRRGDVVRRQLVAAVQDLIICVDKVLRGWGDGLAMCY
jgi:hypothetical protein